MSKRRWQPSGRSATRHLMEEIIASGRADVVEIARGLIAEPDLPNTRRVPAETGDIKKCMRCLACFSSLLTNGQFYCAINPETSRELDCRYEHACPFDNKTVLVAGGGIAGMQAALTCFRARPQTSSCVRKQDARMGRGASL